MKIHPYASFAYAQAFGHHYRAVHVPAWQTYMLIDRIAGSGYRDATFCYPYSALNPGSNLRDGLEQIKSTGAVSVVLMPDPLYGPPAESMARVFSVKIPFKTNYLIDFQLPLRISKHHRYEIRRSQKACEMRVAALSDVLPEWLELYALLTRRHQIDGITRFSNEYFSAIAQMDSFVAIVAESRGCIIAASLWSRFQDIVTNHLGASSEKGYEVGASYAIYAAALELFGDAKTINLGGASGLRVSPDDGLARFKRGFANREIATTVYGEILRPDVYWRLSALAGRGEEFFPAYRMPRSKRVVGHNEMEGLAEQ